MKPTITRRDFLKALIGLSAVQALSGPDRMLSTFDRLSQAGKPNILIVVYDTLAAEHMSVYGYPRETTPHLERFAGQATVFHDHFAAGNFTTPGTASLLTGVYPWTHRAFNIAAAMDPAFARQNLFSLLAGAGYYRLAYTHNLLADYFLHQFSADIDLHLRPDTFFLAGTPTLDRLFRGDPATAYRTSSFLSLILPSERVMPGSLFLSLLNQFRLEQYEATGDPELAKLFPEGLPEEGNSKSFFLLEHAIDGMIDLVREAPQPFLAYFHLYPPHHPYHPRREFIGRFQDRWTPSSKPQHFFTQGESDEDLNQRRRKYDEYLAYADSEFGRLYTALQEDGLVDNTWIVFTSDHGEMFERGIKGHNTPVLYDALVRVPLLVRRPGQTAREDVHTPTSCTDLVPTLALAAGRAVPQWCEGIPLPLFPSAQVDPERPIFALDARRNAKYRPLETGTIVMVKDRHKLIGYFGYPGFDQQYELYDRRDDPQEIKDLAKLNTPATNQMKNELEFTLKEVNLPFLA